MSLTAFLISAAVLPRPSCSPTLDDVETSQSEGVGLVPETVEEEAILKHTTLDEQQLIIAPEEIFQTEIKIKSSPPFLHPDAKKNTVVINLASDMSKLSPHQLKKEKISSSRSSTPINLSSLHLPSPFVLTCAAGPKIHQQHKRSISAPSLVAINVKDI